MRVLITGGAGFIGSHIAEYFAAETAHWDASEHGIPEVRVLDNLRSGSLENLKGLDVDFIEGDIRDRDTVKKAMKGVDYVFHLAAMISVFESMDNPLECVDINSKGTLVVFEEAAKAGVNKLCFSSSSAVYGDNPISSKKETMLPEPKSPYAVTKLDGEFYCNIFTQQNRLNTVSMRYFNVFGPRQDPKSAYAAAIPIFISQAFKNKSLTIYGDGEQTRDFIFVKDVVAANVFLAMHDECIGVYNVGYGTQISINELVKKILRETNSSSVVKYCNERVGDIKHSLGSVDKILSCGFKPHSDFEKGLEETIVYFRNNNKSCS